MSFEERMWRNKKFFEKQLLTHKKSRNVHCFSCKKPARRSLNLSKGTIYYMNRFFIIEYVTKKDYIVLDFCSINCALKKYFKFNKKKGSKLKLTIYDKDDKFYYTIMPSGKGNIIKREKSVDLSKIPRIKISKNPEKIIVLKIINKLAREMENIPIKKIEMGAIKKGINKLKLPKLIYMLKKECEIYEQRKGIINKV